MVLEFNLILHPFELSMACELEVSPSTVLSLLLPMEPMLSPWPP